MIENIKLVLFSFMTAFGLGIVFRIQKKDLVWAGLGSALTRCVYLALLAATENLFMQNLFAAMFAALYAEIMAMKKRTPSTVFLYPAILPLVPGSLLYYVAVNIILGSTPEAIAYLGDLAFSLGGMCLGFVMVSTFTYYRRIYFVSRNIEWHVRAWLKSTFGKKKETPGE